jgi:hypothetical protein
MSGPDRLRTRDIEASVRPGEPSLPPPSAGDLCAAFELVPLPYRLWLANTWPQPQKWLTGLPTLPFLPPGHDYYKVWAASDFNPSPGMEKLRPQLPPFSRSNPVPFLHRQPGAPSHTL